jgi:hypothetical protein
MVISLVPRSE